MDSALDHRPAARSRSPLMFGLGLSLTVDDFAPHPRSSRARC